MTTPPIRTPTTATPTRFDRLDLATDVDVVGAIVEQPWLGAPARSYENRPPTLVDVLDLAVRRHPDRTAFIDGDRRVSYAEFASLVEGAGSLFDEHGLAAGDRFAVAATNSIELATALFAAARHHVVMVGLNVKLAAEQWAYQLAHSGAVAAFAQPEFRDDLELAAKTARLDVAHVTDIAGFGADGVSRPWGFDRTVDRPDEAATFAIVYTSGTTGRPKASQVVHRCSVHSGLSYYRLWSPTADDVAAVVFPLSYISALHAHVIPVMIAGGSLVLVSDTAPTLIADVVARHEVTMLYVVPALWKRLLRISEFAWPAVGHLRIGAFGGAPMPAADIDALRAHLPQVRWHDVYGLSETHSPATMLLDADFARKPGSVGQSLPCMEARVVDVDDRSVTLAPGRDGELELRGSLVTTGYFADQAATDAAIVDGWFRTGDIATIDAEGFVTILDRTKDMINRGGHKVFSAEVERLLHEHPLIAESAVIGVPERAGGEQVMAFVVRSAPDSDLEATEVRRWVRERLADHASPRRVDFVDALPRNPTGKVDKVALRALAAEQRPS